MAGTKSTLPGKEKPARRRGAKAWFYWIVVALSLIGLADATFLTVAHLTGDDAVCGSRVGCSEVLGSPYATVKGIPTAAFGAVAYFVVFSLAVLIAFGYLKMR